MNIDEKMWVGNFGNVEVPPGEGAYIDTTVIENSFTEVPWLHRGEYESPYWGDTFSWWLELPRGLYYYNLHFTAALTIGNVEDHLTAGSIRFQPLLGGINLELNDGNGEYDLWQVYGTQTYPGERLYQDAVVINSFGCNNLHSSMFPVKHSGDKFTLIVGDPFGNDLDGDLIDYAVHGSISLFRIKGLS